MLRSLIERVAVISYLQREGDVGLALWEKGWPYNSRPKLPKLLESVTDFQEAGPEHDFIAAAKELVSHFNQLVHGDPAGLDSNMGVTRAGIAGYLGGANLTDPLNCDRICSLTIIAMLLLMIRATQIFPDAVEPDRTERHAALCAVQQKLKHR